MKPTVSIILTSYNKPALIGKAIQSVMDQTFKRWELYIMDDNSDEETSRIIETFTRDKRIYYYNSWVADEERHKTTRYATLINQAIPLTKGKYLTYLTDDTIFFPERLNTMIHYLNTNQKAHIVYSGQLLTHVDEKLAIHSREKRITRGVLKEAAYRVDHCSVMHTRSIAERVYRQYGDYWDDDPKHWHHGDAIFWNRLTSFAAFYPVNKILDESFKTPYSFQNLNASLPSNIPQGSLIKGTATTVYFIQNNTRRLITKQMLQQLKLKAENIISIPDPFLYKYPLGQPLDESAFSNYKLFPEYRLIKTQDEASVYYIQRGCKRRFQSWEAIKKYQFSIGDILIVEKELLHSFPIGKEIQVKITESTLLPDRCLFECKEMYYFSHANILQTTSYPVIKKLNIDEQRSIKMSETELAFFKKGKL